MDWHKLTAWKDIFSYRQKVFLLVAGGVIVGLTFLFLYLLRMHTYIAGDDPAACVNCHIMTPYYATWSRSSHGRDATCNDCHVPNGNIVAHYGFKGIDGMKHVAYFVTRARPSAPRRPVPKSSWTTASVATDNSTRSLSKRAASTTCWPSGAKEWPAGTATATCPTAA